MGISEMSGLSDIMHGKLIYSFWSLISDGPVAIAPLHHISLNSYLYKEFVCLEIQYSLNAYRSMLTTVGVEL